MKQGKKESRANNEIKGKCKDFLKYYFRPLRCNGNTKLVWLLAEVR